MLIFLVKLFLFGLCLSSNYQNAHGLECCTGLDSNGSCNKHGPSPSEIRPCCSNAGGSLAFSKCENVEKWYLILNKTCALNCKAKDLCNLLPYKFDGCRKCCTVVNDCGENNQEVCPGSCFMDFETNTAGCAKDVKPQNKEEECKVYCKDELCNVKQKKPNGCDLRKCCKNDKCSETTGICSKSCLYQPISKDSTVESFDCVDCPPEGCDAKWYKCKYYCDKKNCNQKSSLTIPDKCKPLVPTAYVSPAPIIQKICYTGSDGEGCLNCTTPVSIICSTTTNSKSYCYKLEKVNANTNQICTDYRCEDVYDGIFHENNRKNVSLIGYDLSGYQPIGIMYRCEGENCFNSANSIPSLIFGLVLMIFISL